MTIAWEGYTEEISTFTFREEGAIRIPKVVREKAFSLQIDIEIVSTLGRGYTNFKSSPPYGFYGYAVLVFRNFAQIQIPINQARQVLFYERVEEAYTNWYKLFLERVDRIWTNNALGVLNPYLTGGDENNPQIEEKACPIWSGFEEIPLREVYIETEFGTQFNLEVSHWKAIVPSGNDSCSYEARSNQFDDSTADEKGKDDGLPPDGTQPQTATNPNFPYGGLPPASTSSQLGAFANDKQAGLDLPNSDNEPETGELLYWAKVTSRVRRSAFPNGCAAERVEITHFAVFSTTTLVGLTPNGSLIPNGCGLDIPSGGWNIQFSGGEPFLIGNSDTTPQVTFESGTSIPPDELFFV